MSATALIAALLLVATPAAPEAPASVRPVVAEVVLQVPSGEDPEPLRALVAIRREQPLTAQDSRRTIRALYQTGRFGNVEVFTFPAGGTPRAPRVRVEVVCERKRVVASVRVEVEGKAPPSVEADALLQAASLPKGDEVYPGRLAASASAMRSLLARHGYRHARVTPRESGGARVDVVFVVDAGAPTRVTAVSIGPDPGLPVETLRQDLRTAPGEVLDEDRLDADVRAIREALRKAGYYRARIGAPRVDITGDAARVDFPVTAGPHITFRFVGDAPFGRKQLREHLGYEGDVPLDATAVEGAAERLQTFLAAYGFAAARVWTEEVASGGEVEVWFHLDPGRVYRLRKVAIAGSVQHDEAWVRTRLDEGFALSPVVDVDQPRADLDSLAYRAGLTTRDPVPYLTSDPKVVFNAEAWRAGTQFVADEYRNDGFLDATVDVRKLTLDPVSGWVDAEVQVKEGARTVVDAVDVEGNGDLPRAEVEKVLTLKAGGPLSLSQVAITKRAVEATYLRTGHVYARVEVVPEISADRTQARVKVRVEEGPLVRVAGVVVEGNKRTRTELILRVVAFREGEAFDPERAATAQADLLRLGVFRSASIHLADPDVPQESKTVVVDVEERAWQTLVGTAGISIAEGPRVGAEYDLPNLFGNAIEFSARAKVNYPLAIFRPDLEVIPPAERLEWLGELGLRQPRAFDLRSVALRGDLIGQHKIQAAYQMMRGAIMPGIDLVRLGRLSASFTGVVEVDDVASRTAYPIIDTTLPQEARQLFPLGLTWLFSLQPRIMLDLRDNAARPTFGLYAEVLADYSHSIGSASTTIRSDTHINLVKVQGTLSGYLPIWNLVLALSAQAGQVFALDAESVTIAPKRFYLGGATTMRGYGENEMIPEDQRAVVAAQTQRCASVLSGLGCSPQLQQLVSQGIMLPSQGAQAMVLFRAELRVPMTKATELGFFADIGNLWYDPTLVDLTKLRTNVGFGIRILTPVGPAAFDIGFNVNPDYRINEPLVVPHFAVGFF